MSIYIFHTLSIHDSDLVFSQVLVKDCTAAAG